MANLRQEIAVGDTGAEFVAALIANAKNANIRVYNVEDYGAVHDGETDDTVAIQAAINACSDAGGGKVYLPNGTYIISGDLQNDIGEDVIDYNSQLYIPYFSAVSGDRKCIVIEGETPPPYAPQWSPYGVGQYGVILKSTITGSGVYPSVIGSAGPVIYGPLNYNDCHIKNLSIITTLGDNGPTMCGINFIRTSHSYIDEVYVSTDYTNILNIPQPTSKVFGIGIGLYLDDFPIIGRARTNGGYYYGFVLGEGVHCRNITSTRNYIGILSLSNAHYNYVDFASLHWNTYHVANQDETIYGRDAGYSFLQIDKGSCENDENPAWSHMTAMVLDTENKLVGSWRSDTNGNLPMTKSGGNNFLMFDARKRNDVPTWTTATRPGVYLENIIGFNSTTGKLEGYTASGWVDLH